MMTSADPVDMAQTPLAPTTDLAENASAPTANAARIYDVLLGGMHNTLVDRAAAAEQLRLVPGAVMAAYQNKQFIRRSVQYLVRQAGIRQFIDIGIGRPAHCAVHQIAGQSAPRVRVLCTDNNPLVLSLARTLLAGHPNAAVIGHDLRDPAGLLRHPALRALLDLDQLAHAAAPGSYLALSHATSDHLPAAVAQQVSDLHATAGAPFIPRSKTEIATFLDGLEILPPGLVNGSAWRAGRAAVDPRRTLFYAALARRP